MPRAPKKASKVPKVLILTKRLDMCKYSMRWATELGFETYGSNDMEESKRLIAAHDYVFCCLGCVLVNDKQHLQDLTELKALLDAKGVPYAKMPTFGDIREPLVEAGLVTIDKDLNATLLCDATGAKLETLAPPPSPPEIVG